MPKRVTYVLRLETLERDLERMLAAMPLVAKNHSLEATLPKRENTHEGHFNPDELRESSPNGIRKALAYLAQDYACLDYDPPNPEGPFVKS